MVAISAILSGCIAEGDYDAPEEPAEEMAEARQELTAGCTTQGSGGGTWGDVIKLCRTSSGGLYVQKRSGTFTSSGYIYLYNGSGSVVASQGVPQDTLTVNFGYRPPGWYYVYYSSNAPGEAWTGWLQN
ncbi:hypothetical protein [Polyangium aurulentum]|uniref:hypothetical protein n=1 Tax=Polyangium aurulentum TaxID=2567896 RepID=UPI0010AE552D|nr:hypothetical protein [Polyangium aurulentum]UQA57089.1 hypothetical protein E8A73_038235 [Polyangium aurulentum]